MGDSSREDKFKRHRREPKFSYVSAHDVVKAPITKTEIDTWKKNNGDLIQENDYYTKIETERIRRAIRRDRGDHYLKTAPFETSLVRNKSNANTDVLRLGSLIRQVFYCCL